MSTPVNAHYIAALNDFVFKSISRSARNFNGSEMMRNFECYIFFVSDAIS